MIVEVGRVHMIIELAAGHGRSRQTSIHTSLIQSQRICRRKHTDIGQDRSIILGVAVAVGRDIQHQRDMEVRTTIHHSLCILGHTTVQELGSLLILKRDGIKVTSTQTTAATYAVVGVNLHLAGIGIEIKSVVSALRKTLHTTTTTLLADARLATAMLVGLTRTRSATHTDILNRATKTCHLMALEVVKADEDIGIHYGATDLCTLDILTAHNGNIHIVRALQTITNNDRATNSQGSKSILPSAIEVLNSIFTATRIHRITIGKERLATQRLYGFNHRASVVRTQVRDITQLTEVHLDGNELTIHINICKTCFKNQLAQLCRKTVSVGLRTEVGKKYF